MANKDTMNSAAASVATRGENTYTGVLHTTEKSRFIFDPSLLFWRHVTRRRAPAMHAVVALTVVLKEIGGRKLETGRRADVQRNKSLRIRNGCCRCSQHA